MTTPAPNSLRKKNRNADALPRRQSSFPAIPENAAATGPMPPPPRVRPRDKSKVESMMKRRYSTRGMPPPAAALEPFPEELMQKTKVPEPGIVEKRLRGQSRARPTFDASALAGRGFDPEQYIATSLAGASEEDIQSFYDSLRDLQASTASELQSNVFENYASFVSLSHEISNLTADLSNLSTLLVQFSNLTQSLGNVVQKDSDGDPNGYSRERRGAARRTSINDLAQIHSSYLQELWHFVEGSQKFLPAQPGRHVIRESLNWTELNAATWKPIKTVHLILLNDHLLVAAKKRGKASVLQPRHSVADRCWNLMDIEVVELDGDHDITTTTHAIQIRRGREVAVYAPPESSASECALFVQAYRRANIDLHNQRRQNDERALKTSHSPMLFPISENLKGNDAFLRRVSMNFSLDGRRVATFTSDNPADPGSLRWIQDRMDELDVHIALRDFEDSVEGIEKERQILTSMDPKSYTHPLVSLHLSHQTQQLTSILSQALEVESHLPQSTKRYSGLLIRLGEGDLARSTYLGSRAEDIREKVRAMQHPGAYGANEVHTFLEAVAWLVVRVLRNSWTVYSETFAESKMTSIFFQWAQGQVEEFAKIFQRQLYGYSADSQLYQNSKDGVVKVWSELKALGLDMTFLLETLIKKTETVVQGTSTSESTAVTEGVEGRSSHNSEPLQSKIKFLIPSEDLMARPSSTVSTTSK